MPVTINGSGTITGVSVGGLPDGIVDADMLALNAVTAGKLASGVGGKFASYAMITDQKANNSSGGIFTSGAWRTRDLNTEIEDTDGIVSISSNQFELAAGTYLVNASAPAHRVNTHQIRIYNATDSSIVQLGTLEFSHSAYATTTRSFASKRFTISATKSFEIQHRCSYTYGTTSSPIGYGRSQGLGNNELYTLVEIYKES